MVAKKLLTFDNIILLLGVLLLGYLLSLDKPTSELDYPYPYAYWAASAMLRGISEYPAYPEISQDLVGLQHVARGVNAYPPMREGFAELGIGYWDANNETTHPPTAFLLLAPFAFLPLKFAIAGWAWLMLVLLASTLVCYGFSRKMALGLAPILLLWTPVAYSLSQLTIVWMWGIAIGYRFARDRAFWGGVGIGIASLTKFFPALLIVGYLVKKQWVGLIGFIAVWAFAGLALIGLDAKVFSDYLDVNRTNSLTQLVRPENAALPGFAFRWGGWLAALVVVLIILGLAGVLYWRFKERVLERTYLWMGLSYMAVALLPLMWIYSVTPLLPVIFYLLSRKKLSTMFAGVLGLVFPGLVGRAMDVALTTGVVGIGLVLDLLPFRLFTARTLKEFYDKSSTGFVSSSPSRGLSGSVGQD